jgi:ribulose-phosphate 3-epimerase
MRRIEISPSLLSADFAHLGKEISKVEKAGAKYLHFDVMDGHFVPNISFGLPVLKSLHGHHHMISDVHIMISDPLRYGPLFVEAGADIVTFHYEALADDSERLAVIQSIRLKGGRVGMSIKPATEVNVLVPFLPHLDLVLIMSVEPGFGGQAFMTNALERIAFLRRVIDQNNYQTLIEVDGGITDVTAPGCIQAGVDILVAGSFLFGHDDLKERMLALLKG